MFEPSRLARAPLGAAPRSHHASPHLRRVHATHASRASSHRCDRLSHAAHSGEVAEVPPLVGSGGWRLVGARRRRRGCAQSVGSACVCREATARAGRRRLVDGRGAAGCGRACVGRVRHSLADGVARLWSRRWAHSVVCRMCYLLTYSGTYVRLHGRDPIARELFAPFRVASASLKLRDVTKLCMLAFGILRSRTS